MSWTRISMVPAACALPSRLCPANPVTISGKSVKTSMRIARPLEVEEPIGRVDGDATRLLGGDEHDWHEGTPVEHEQVAGGVRLDLRDGADLRAVARKSTRLNSSH